MSESSNPQKQIKPTGTTDHLVMHQAKLNSMVIAIGASTGGTESTLKVLREFPKDSPPVLIVQHMPPGFTAMYAQRLDSLCKLNVKEAQNGDVLKAGHAYLAPGDLQMRLTLQGKEKVLSVRSGDKVSSHRPSVDVLFHSVAETMKQHAIGIIMTGMGRDGAAGLLAMRNAGAYTLGEDKTTCVVYGMPMEAKKIGAVMMEVPNHSIVHMVQKQLNK
ncbi:MAG: CheB methylesterase domain-containing protein [Bacillota bacterium]